MKIFRHIWIPSLLLSILVSCKNNKSGHAASGEIPAFETQTEGALIMDTVQLTAADGLPVRAVLYYSDSTATTIVLCHQARFNNYEYAEIAPKLVSMGFSCLALDQRSGGTMDTHINATYEAAIKAGLETNYARAKPDISAGVEFAAAFSGKPVILWGSSYSATLVMQVAMENPNVKATVAFSPILQFDNKESAVPVFSAYQNKPLFITSTEKEGAPIAKALTHLDDTVLYQYYPDMKGTHGSKALWNSDPVSEAYWSEVKAWLLKHK